MKTLNCCPSCGSGSIAPYSRTVEAERGNALHYSQSRCRWCDLVFSNPVVEAEELGRFYNDLYYEKVEQVYRAGRADLESLVRDRAAAAARGLRDSVLPYVSGGVFFEIGAGYGALMAGARSLGFEVAGVEPSLAAATFGRKVLGLDKLKHGIFCASDWTEAFYDVVYSFQVIEHVLDPVEFVRGIRRILKPGGLTIIGTENHHNSWVIYRRARSWMLGRRWPEFQTGSHHTLYFSDQSLRRLLEHEGFEIMKCLVYTHSLEEKLKTSRFRSIFSKLFFYLLHYSDVWTGRGGRLLVWCRKPK